MVPAPKIHMPACANQLGKTQSKDRIVSTIACYNNCLKWNNFSLKEKKIMAKPVQQSVVQKVGNNFLDCELSVTRHCPALEQPWPTVQETQKSSQNIKSNIFSVEFNKLWQE